MIDDRNPYWGRSFQISSAQLGDLKRKWGEAGRRAYETAIRTGRDVLARTEGEIEALGRAQLKHEELQRAQATATVRAAGDAITSVGNRVRKGARVVGERAGAAAKAQADMALVSHGQQTRAVEAAGEGVAQAASFPAHVVRQGTHEDPGPGRLVGEWATGLGPDARVLGPQSSFSREFAQAPSVQAHLRNAIRDWRERDGGRGVYSNYDGEFWLPQYAADLVAGNGASHVIGSFRLDGQRHDDQIDWEAANDMGRHSLFYGNALNKVGLPGVPNAARPEPTGTTRQVIRFSTDLNGRPTPTSRDGRR